MKMETNRRVRRKWRMAASKTVLWGVCGVLGWVLFFPSAVVADCFRSSECDDYDPCNGSGYCSTPPGQPPPYQCVYYPPPNCDNGNPCDGVETCVPYEGCVAGQNLDCDDGLKCTWDDCEDGVGCQYTPVPCNPSHACETGTCDPLTGSCLFQPRACEDGNVCNGIMGCNTTTGCYLQTPAPVCNDNSLCTTDSCQPATGCQFVPIPCVDTNFCTIESCPPTLGCQHVIKNCADTNDCTDDSCNPANGNCIHNCNGSAPGGPDAPEPSDRLFVKQANYASQYANEVIQIDIEVDRYAGPTDASPTEAYGHLQHAQALILGGLAHPVAELTVAAFGVDCFGEGNCNDSYPVYFDSYFAGYLINPAGTECRWFTNTFQIPLSQVKFPKQRGQLGSSPVDAINSVSVLTDAVNSPTCFKIKWVSLKVGLMSPIVLVHGNNSNPGIFQRQQFTNGLDAAHVPYDASIQFASNSVSTHAEQLAGILPNSEFPGSPTIKEVVTSFGCDSAHIIAHSKGGLDVRAFLADYYDPETDGFSILSLSTLSTPHQGSAGADILQKRADAAEEKAKVFYGPDFPAFSSLVTELLQLTGNESKAARKDLTTWQCADFSAFNIPRLPFIDYYLVASDADENLNGQIDNIPDEYVALRQENTKLREIYDWPGLGPPTARSTVDAMYQLLRTTATATIEFDDLCNTFANNDVRCIKTAIMIAVKNTNEVLEPNDTMVTATSGLCPPLILERRANAHQVFHAGRNHVSIAGPAIAADLVAKYLKTTERMRGDLVP